MVGSGSAKSATKQMFAKIEKSKSSITASTTESVRTCLSGLLRGLNMRRGLVRPQSQSGKKNRLPFRGQNGIGRKERRTLLPEMQLQEERSQRNHAKCAAKSKPKRTTMTIQSRLMFAGCAQRTMHSITNICAL